MVFFTAVLPVNFITKIACVMDVSVKHRDVHNTNSVIEVQLMIIQHLIFENHVR